MEAFLQQLQQRRAAVINDRARAFAQRQAAIDVRAEAGRRKFTTAEAQVYRNAQTQIAECDETIAALDKRIAHQKEEIRRAGRDPNDPNPLVTQLMQARGNGGGGDAKAMGESWARRTAQLIAGGRGEARPSTPAAWTCRRWSCRASYRCPGRRASSICLPRASQL